MCRYQTREEAERAILHFNMRHVLPDPAGEQDRPLAVRVAYRRHKLQPVGIGMSHVDPMAVMGDMPVHLQMPMGPMMQVSSAAGLYTGSLWNESTTAVLLCTFDPAQCVTCSTVKRSDRALPRQLCSCA